MPPARDARSSGAASPPVPAPEPAKAEAPDGPAALSALIAALQADAPELTRDGAILLVCQMSEERGSVPLPDEALAWLGRFKQSQPMAWPSAVAGNAIGFAKLLEFARYPGVVEAVRLRELMSHVHASLPS